MVEYLDLVQPRRTHQLQEQLCTSNDVPDFTLRAARRLSVILSHLSFHKQELQRDPSYERNDRPQNWTTKPKIHSAHSQLQEGEITRLLVLQPGLPDQDLHGHLKHVRSLPEHEYEALSYTWGDEPWSGHTIQCSDMPFKLTVNLDAALRHLRYQDRPRLLWVDAICINQDSEIDKTRQIRIMRDIYANARQVVVWLGPQDDADSQALSCLRRVQILLNDQNSLKFLARLGWYKDKDKTIYSGGVHGHFMSDTQYDHVINLLQRPWFRRTWIVQELASSKRAVVLCGTEMIAWETLAKVYMSFGDRFLPDNKKRGTAAHHALESITAIEKTRRSLMGPIGLSLFHILVSTAQNQCEDKRDKIFGVLGLAKEWVDRSVLLPIYEQGREEEEALKTFKKFTVEDITYFKHLRALSCASGPYSQLLLPSWVPDWGQIENFHPFTRYSDRTGFHASGRTRPEAWFSENDLILNVVGMPVDTVSKLGPDPLFTKTIAVFEIDRQKISQIQDSYKWLWECQELIREKDQALTTQRQQEFRRTMICGLTDEGFPAPKHHLTYVSEYLDYLRDASSKFLDYFDEARGFPDGVTRLEETIPGFENHARIEAAIARWSAKRRFAMMDSGRLAFVPKGTRRGDVICVLLEAEVPYVLRPFGKDTYSVVGECYVDGIMHGESLSFGIGTTEFRLR